MISMGMHQNLTSDDIKYSYNLDGYGKQAMILRKVTIYKGTGRNQ
jgi:hypothetical protein